MAERFGPLEAFGLATFHVCLLTALAMLLLHGGGALGDLLASLGTGLGLATFALLWGITVFSTRQALARLAEPIRAGHVAMAAAMWGGATGALFLVLQQVGLVLVTRAPLAQLLFPAVAAPFAFIAGALIGLVLGALDLLLLAAAGRLP